MVWRLREQAPSASSRTEARRRPAHVVVSLVDGIARGEAFPTMLIAKVFTEHPDEKINAAISSVAC